MRFCFGFCSKCRRRLKSIFGREIAAHMNNLLSCASPNVHVYLVILVLNSQWRNYRTRCRAAGAATSYWPGE